MNKKLLLLALFAAIFSFIACGGNSSSISNTGDNEKSEVTEADTKEHTYFMDLQMGGDPEQFIATLRDRGFEDGWGFSSDENEVFLRGEVYGEMSQLSVDTNGGKVISVRVWNEDSYTEQTAKKRYEVLIAAQKERYGDACEVDNSIDGFCKIKLPYGTIICDYGCYDSGEYTVNLAINDFVEEESQE